jgi:hypothetical protein
MEEGVEEERGVHPFYRHLPSSLLDREKSLPPVTPIVLLLSRVPVPQGSGASYMSFEIDLGTHAPPAVE